MGDNTDQLNDLLSKLNSLTRKQDDFAKEISGLREEMLKITRAAKQAEPDQQVTDVLKETENNPEEATEPLIAQTSVRFYQTTQQLHNHGKNDKKEKEPERN